MRVVRTEGHVQHPGRVAAQGARQVGVLSETRRVRRGGVSDRSRRHVTSCPLTRAPLLPDNGSKRPSHAPGRHVSHGNKCPTAPPQSLLMPPRAGTGHDGQSADAP